MYVGFTVFPVFGVKKTEKGFSVNNRVFVSENKKKCDKKKAYIYLYIMWDMDGRSERRAYRDQDPPRIRNKSTENLVNDELEISKSTPSSPTSFNRVGATLGFEKCRSDPEFSKIENKTPSSFLNEESETRTINARQKASSAASENVEKHGIDEFVKELIAKVPDASSGFKTRKEVR